MFTEIRTTKTTWYCSESDPSLETNNAALGEVLAWADEHEVAYRIARERKSRAFGIGSHKHIGWAQKDASVQAVFERIATLKRASESLSSFKRDMATFVLEHYDESGFTGGFFQQHVVWTDGKEYARGCLMLDYTPELLELVIDRFCAWTKAAHYQGATRITIEGKDVRVFEAICEAGARPEAICEAGARPEAICEAGARPEDCEGGAELR